MRKKIKYNGKVFINALHGVPDFPEYKNTKPEDWYWEKGSNKKDNKFIWRDENETDSKKWR